MNFKSLGIPTIKLFVIATFVTVLLFVTNNVTAAKIVQNQEEADVQSRQAVLPEADGFDEKTINVDGADVTYYEATNGAGYVFSGANKGYGGDVVCMIGISADGTITGVAVTQQAETAGLGAKWAGSDAAGQEKRDQFKDQPAAEDFAVVKDGGSIEAVAGATITSRAVTNDVNDAIKYYKAVVGGAN